MDFYLELWHEPTEARPSCHKDVGLVPDIEHPHKVRVEVSLGINAGDDIRQLVFLNYECVSKLQ